MAENSQYLINAWIAIGICRIISSIFPWRVLELGDYDVILGVDWMRTYTPVNFDFAENKLVVCKEGKVELVGIKEKMALRMMSLKSINKLITKGWKWVTSRLLVMVSKPEPNPVISPLPNQNSLPIPHPITTLLAKYNQLFETPTKLAPQRTQDHAIPLKPGLDPVNIRPYRYSHHQKDEIERLLEEMTGEGVIRPSQSPYASPVL